jgi:hypothetical protein
MRFIIDRLAPGLLEGELRVLLFITRQTAGWGKVRDAISVSQIMKGIGDREETEMGKNAVVRSYKSLEASGFIRILRPSCKRGNVPLTFELMLPIGELRRPTGGGKIAMQTRMSPLESDRTVGRLGDRPRPDLAMVDSGGGIPREPRSKPKVVSQRHRGGIPEGPGWCSKDTEGGIPKTPTRLETTLENNTRETTTTSGVSSSSFSPREVILDRKVSELVAAAYQVFDGTLPIESTVEQWALVAQESRDAAGELGDEAFAGYCQLAARTTAKSDSVKCPGSRVKYFLGTLDRMLRNDLRLTGDLPRMRMTTSGAPMLIFIADP